MSLVNLLQHLKHFGYYELVYLGQRITQAGKYVSVRPVHNCETEVRVRAWGKLRSYSLETSQSVLSRNNVPVAPCRLKKYMCKQVGFVQVPV